MKPRNQSSTASDREDGSGRKAKLHRRGVQAYLWTTESDRPSSPDSHEARKLSAGSFYTSINNASSVAFASVYIHIYRLPRHALARWVFADEHAGMPHSQGGPKPCVS